MGNHLIELIEFSKKGMSYRGSHRENIKSAQNAVNKAMLVSERAICFDIGEYEQIHKRIKFELEPSMNLDIPFGVSWFEINTPHETWCVLIEKHSVDNCEKNMFIWTWFSRLNRDWQYQFSMQTWGMSDPYVALFDCDKDSERAMHGLRGAVLKFLAAISCKNVKKVEHSPDEKLQKARAKRGKKPLFSYWTLELTDTKTEHGASLGGTHASPRLHLRRGHPRQFKPGEWTWVQPCVVGNKSLGMVHKDYKFVPSEMAA